MPSNSVHPRSNTFDLGRGRLPALDDLDVAMLVVVVVREAEVVEVVEVVLASRVTVTVAAPEFELLLLSDLEALLDALLALVELAVDTTPPVESTVMTLTEPDRVKVIVPPLVLEKPAVFAGEVELAAAAVAVRVPVDVNVVVTPLEVLVMTVVYVVAPAPELVYVLGSVEV